MFGSVTFFVNNNMFAGVHEDNVILRLSEADRQETFSSYSPFVGSFKYRLFIYITVFHSESKELEFFSYLTPCVPLSFKGEGEEKKRGWRPS